MQCIVHVDTLIIFILTIMRFMVLVNGNYRPPACTCKIQEIRAGNYSLTWSGLRPNLLAVLLLESGGSKLFHFQKQCKSIT